MLVGLAVLALACGLLDAPADQVKLIVRSWKTKWSTALRRWLISVDLAN